MLIQLDHPVACTYSVAFASCLKTQHRSMKCKYEFYAELHSKLALVLRPRPARGFDCCRPTHLLKYWASALSSPSRLCQVGWGGLAERFCRARNRSGGLRRSSREQESFDTRPVRVLNVLHVTTSERVSEDVKSKRSYKVQGFELQH